MLSKTSFKIALILAALFALTLACGQTPTEEAPAADPVVVAEEESAAEPTDVPASPTTVPATATSAPTETPVPPTPTEVPPTATATEIPDPVVISEETAGDGCTIVELNPGTWSPLFNAYKGGSDPFFHIHTMEAPGDVLLRHGDVNRLRRQLDRSDRDFRSRLHHPWHLHLSGS